jgi:hypothetical protein
MLVIGTFSQAHEPGRSKEKLAFEEVRWMEIKSYLEKASRPIRQIEFNGKPLNMTTIHEWRRKLLQGDKEQI